MPPIARLISSSIHFCARSPTTTTWPTRPAPPRPQELCHTQLIADSPFFNIFTNVFLRALTRAEALQLITRPSAEAGAPLEGYARRILEIAGYFPYFLQIACSAYFDHLLENDGKLDREEVEATFLDEAKGQFRFIWDHLNDSFRGAVRESVENGRVEKEHEHIYEDLKRAGFFIQDDRGPRIFSTLFSSVISRPRIITTELRETDRAAMAVHDGKTEKVAAPPLIEPHGHIGRFEIRRTLGAGGMGRSSNRMIQSFIEPSLSRFSPRSTSKTKR
jgi:serine/threonine-protein kinase